MSPIQYKFHKVFRETPDVIFYDISVEDSNATDLVIHNGPATSPPNKNEYPQFYIHLSQVDNNRVLSGSREFQLINPIWEHPNHIIHLNRSSGALVIPKGTYHRSVSCERGSILINQAIRDLDFDVTTEFIPVSVLDNEELFHIWKNIEPIHQFSDGTIN